MKKNYVIRTVHGYLVSFKMDGYDIQGEEYTSDKFSAYKFKNTILLNKVKEALIIEEAEVEEL